MPFVSECGSRKFSLEVCWMGNDDPRRAQKASVIGKVRGDESKGQISHFEGRWHYPPGSMYGLKGRVKDNSNF